MIFVSLGTQIFQLNRLLVEIDRLIEEGIITETVFAQIGRSNYVPRYFDYKDFITPEEYQNYIDESTLIITHGGVGAIIKGLKANKQIIAIPRRKKYNEHENDHQIEIVRFFSENGYIYQIDEVNELQKTIEMVKERPISKKFVSDGHVAQIIDSYILNSFFGGAKND